MSGEYEYFINRYWIAEYIQYLQEFGVVLGCLLRVERANGPMNATPCFTGLDSPERALPWEEDEVEPPEWLSYNELFSVKGHDVLRWLMRWVDSVC
jgi:hypothetical protein